MHEEEYQRIVGILRQRVENTPDVLMATQASVSIPIIERIAKKIQNNLFSPTITVLDNRICHGHHRYLATLLINGEVRIQPGSLGNNQPIYELTGLVFERSDWDKPLDIERFMKEAAEFNECDLAEIRKILSNSLIL